MIIQENVTLAPHTTFKIGGPARFFCIATDEPELTEAVAFAKKEKRRILVLGGGSNVLIADAGFSGVVIKNEIMGKEVIAEDGDSVTISVGAGEQWDEFVEYAVGKDLYGIENLSAIPGTVGAAPVQNIGAYGCDISETVAGVRALDTTKMKYVDLTNEECGFEYRESMFKNKKGRYAISRVVFRLRKNGEVNVGYRDLKEHFKDSPAAPSLREVRQAVIEIRWNKLPDWKLWGTAGSFFKNPIIAAHRYAKLKEKYPEAPGFPQSDGRVKVPVAWILDKICHVKGVMEGNVGSYENQALVFVTKPGATAAEVISFAKKLMDQVEKETTIKIEGEVEWVN